METQGLDEGAVLVNKYSQMEVQVTRHNEAKNWYDAVRLSDGKTIAVGMNWWNSYVLKSSANPQSA